MMNKTIKHRWPDWQGIWLKVLENQKLLWLSQVRLAIVDLSNAWHQPMFYNKKFGCFSELHQPQYMINQTQEYVSIVFNWEIYNYQKIRKELQNKGYCFSSNSDTEVILASYMERWLECLQHFNGMRSFVIYDPQQELLFCSRDELGKKPFYYYIDDQNFIFSSQIKAILNHKDIIIPNKEQIDIDALDFYFTLGNIPAPWSIYKNIKKLPARHNLIVSLKNKEIKTKIYCYQDIPSYKPINNKKILIHDAIQLLEDTIQIRTLSSDVAVGAYLSGWLDSSTIVGEMTDWVDKNKIHTFSVWFDGQYDETKYINIATKAFNTKHHHHYFKQKDFESLLNDINLYYDEPFADYSNFPTTFISKFAKKNVSVILSGDWWDEIFGGYIMHKIAAQMAILYSIPLWIKQIIYHIIPNTKDNLSILSQLKEAIRVSMRPPQEFYAQIGASSIYKPAIYQQWAITNLSEVMDAAHGNFTQAVIDFDLWYNTLSDNFLVKVDRSSMSQGLEIRSPFLDKRRIERSRKVPVSWKVNWRRTKILMREIIKDRIPHQILNRWKQWFTPPLQDWILQEKYLYDIRNWIDVLYRDWLLNSNWYQFYNEKVMKSNNRVFNVYKIRLFILWKWYQTWISW